MDQTQKMRLAIGLPPRNAAGLNQLLHDLYDPASPRYGQYIMPAQFTEQFGPSTEDYESLMQFAKVHGLKVTKMHANRLLLDVEGSVADIEKSFHVTMRTYQHPTEARTFFAPDADPSPETPVRLLNISGLDDYSLPHPNLKVRSAEAMKAPRVTPYAGSGPSGSYAGNDFRNAYVPGSTLTGTGQSIALLEFDLYYKTDIDAYATQFGLPSVPLVPVYIDGGPSTPGTGVTEVSLDIEMAMSMAPGLSSIYVYMAPQNAPWVDILNGMATDNLCKQISCSWGAGAPNPAAEVIFQQMAAQGQSFFAASGDSDAYTGTIPFPSDSPNITQVGATTLTTGTSGAYTSETVWNWGLAKGKYLGTSGGVSTTFSIPTWQQGISMTTNQGSTTMRNVPDVCMVGDAVYVKTNNGNSQTVGGTSCAAPLWAGLTALVNQQGAINGRPPVGFLNPKLYSIAQNPPTAGSFHDITAGNNKSAGSPSKFSAVSGYDLCTGWGSPVGGTLIRSLAGPFIPTITGLTPASAPRGSSVVIMGTDFLGATSVTFNGSAASFTINSPTQITATVPSDATTGRVRVTTPTGTTVNGPNFVVTFNFTPTAATPGNTVTLSGYGFTGASAVTFNGATASFTVNSDTQITTTVPASATTGPISVTTTGGVVASGSDFTVLTSDGSPTLASFTPGSASVGASVTLNGTNFVNVMGVSFNGVPATFTVNSQSQITAAVPAPSGSTVGPITVTTALGSVTSSGSFTTLPTAITYNSATDVPITASSFSAAGITLNLALNFAPAAGTNFTLVKNTGNAPIQGTFANLAQGQIIVLGYNGGFYRFIVNYFGGRGNDIVLQWADTRPVGWGYNSQGQLATKASNTSLPTATDTSGVLSGKTVLMEAMGTSHSLALCSDGTVAAWGRNSSGELGDGTFVNTRTVPVLVNTGAGSALAGKTVVWVGGGYSHSLALCSDGSVVMWGSINGISTALPILVSPTGALAGKTVMSVASGGRHCLALCSDGTVAAWGFNGYGELGNNSTTSSNIPVAVDMSGALAGKTVTALFAGGDFSLALCSDGTAAAWGYGGSNALGDLTNNDSHVPIPVRHLSDTALAGKFITKMAAGGGHTLALCSDGTVVSWGLNNYGQLSHNQTGGLYAGARPVMTIAGSALFGKVVTALAAGSADSIYSCSDGSTAAAGYNSNGQLGDNTNTSTDMPVLVKASQLSTGEVLMPPATGQSADHFLALVAQPPTVQITVQQPVGNTLANGGTVNFGGTTIGSSVPLTFTVQNSGLAPLVISSVSIDGVNAGDFSATTPNSPIPVGDSATLTVTFAPQQAFDRRAVLHLVSNDPVNNSFDLTLTGYTPGTLNATFGSASDTPLNLGSFNATGSTVNLALNYAPATGASLTVVNNMGPAFIQGAFSNLAQGQIVTLSYHGQAYRFFANYYGGTGNDLVLQWADTRLMAWGYNYNGQLGNNSINDSPVPVAVTTSGTPLAGKTVLAAASGAVHSVTVCTDGTLATWGNNIEGELGNNGNPSRVPVPVTISGTPLHGKTVVAVVAPYLHCLALCTDGTVAAWGYNSNGQLGNNSTTLSQVPVAVSTSADSALAGKTVTAISGGYQHSLALCSDGTMAAWGYNFYGQLGNNDTFDSHVPVPVDQTGALADKTVTMISCGQYHNIALCSDGTVVTWGSAGNGALGNNSFSSNSRVPIAVNTTAGVAALAGKTVIAVAAGGQHNVVLCSDGSVVTWGNNLNGQLGNNGFSSSALPVPVNTTPGISALAGKTVVGIAAGYSNSFALCSDGTAVAWGINGDGQLGNNNLGVTESHVPVAVSMTSLAAGETFTRVSGGVYTSHCFGIVAAPPPPSPVVTTLAATAVTSSSATLNATVNPKGTSTTASFQYGGSASYGMNTTGQNLGSGTLDVPISASLTGLSAHTTYHFAASIGSQNGSDFSFTTLDNAPVTNADTVNNVTGPVVISVLANDTDADGDTLTISDITQGSFGSVTINGANVTYTPGASFSTSDVFFYTVSDGFGGSATGSVTVYAPPLVSWRAQKFGSDAGNPAISGNNADPNNNGIPNLVEYALNGDPLGSGGGTSIAPKTSLGGGNALQLSFSRYLDHTDITLIVQAADAPNGPWNDLASSTAGGAFTILASGATVNESGSGNARAVVVGDVYQVTDPAHPRRFMRLKVTQP